jgi:hypothetical protein
MAAQSIFTSCSRYNVAELETEIKTIRAVMDFGCSTYSHSLSLPAETDIESGYRSHRNNIPYADALKSCPLFSDIFIQDAQGIVPPAVPHRRQCLFAA